jgi:DNA polymerase I
VLSFDTETTGLDPRKCHPTHVGTYDGIEFRMVQAYQAPNIVPKLIMHNGKFDTLMLWWNHKVWVPWAADTMLLSQLYDSRVKHKLDNIGELYLGEGKWGDKKVLQAIKKGEFWLLPEEQQRAYLERDCVLTYGLYNFFKDRLSRKLWGLYENFDQPLSLALAQIETNGFTIDEEMLHECKRNVSERLEPIRMDLRREFGDCDLNSPMQVLEAIRSKYKVHLSSTSERSLQVAAKHFPGINRLFEYRELTKYLNTYIGGLEKHLWQGKVYPQFHLAGDYHTSNGRSTATGRTSSSNPNLQNQPRPGSGPVNIRNLFKASEGNVLLACDYNQLELKVAAFLSGETNLLQGDIHQRAADILKIGRSEAKNINFAKLYNAQRAKIFYMSGGSKHVDKYIQWFEDQFPKAVRWCEETTRRCHEEGKVETHLGRVRYLDRSEVGPNSIIQGSAGDIGKEAAWLSHASGYRTLGIIHDEVIVEVPEGEVHDAAIDIQRLMTSGLKANGAIHEMANLAVSCKTGKRWGEMKAL